MWGAAARIASVVLVFLVAGGCGGSSRPRPAPEDTSGIPGELLRESRPIGRGPRFQPPVRGSVTGPCRAPLGRRHGVHVELFAADRVVIVARGIGVRPPLSFSGGRIIGARCYGDVVTLEPTGVVLVRPGTLLHLGDLFRAWGQPLSRRRLASFIAPAGTEVAVFVNGRRLRAMPQSVPLRSHDEIVLEVGPFVPPHRTYTFPPGA
jgi:hypothetical protein